MSELDDIHQTYTIVHQWMNSAEAGDRFPTTGSWALGRILNDYAYFLFLFGKLEQFINQEYAAFVGDPAKAAFEHQVNLLYSHDLKTAGIIKDYYRIRCEVAHGRAEAKALPEPYNITTVYSNIKQLLS